MPRKSAKPQSIPRDTSTSKEAELNGKVVSAKSTPKSSPKSSPMSSPKSSFTIVNKQPFSTKSPPRSPTKTNPQTQITRIHVSTTSSTWSLSTVFGYTLGLTIASMLLNNLVSIVLSTYFTTKLSDPSIEYVNYSHNGISKILLSSRIYSLFWLVCLAISGNSDGKAYLLALGAYSFLSQPFKILLYLFYGRSIQNFFITNISGIITSLIGSTAYMVLTSRKSSLTWSLALILGTSTVLLYAIGLYGFARQGILSGFVIKYFTDIPTVERVHNMDFVSAVGLCSLMGLVFPFYIQGQEVKQSLVRQQPLKVLQSPWARSAVLSHLVWQETVIQTLKLIRGATLSGVIGYAGIWAFLTFVLGLYISWVLAPLKDDEDMELEVKVT